MMENPSTALVKSQTVSPALARVSGQLAVTERLLNISLSFTQEKIETENACLTIEEWKKLSDTEKRRVCEESEEFRVKLEDYNNSSEVNLYMRMIKKGPRLEKIIAELKLIGSDDYAERLSLQLELRKNNLYLSLTLVLNANKSAPLNATKNAQAQS